MTRRRRTGWAAVVVVVALGAAGGAWVATRSSPAGASPRLVMARDGTIRQSVSATGTVEPARVADLDFTTGGKVSAVDVVVGQSVVAGQALASVDPTSLSLQVAQAQAALSSDQARLSSDQGAGASSVQLEADQATIAAAQAQLTNAQASLSDATLTSPIAGAVASIDLTVGQQVAASSGAGSSGAGSGSAASSSPSTTSQVVVIGTGAYTVAAAVDDTVVGEVKVGDQAVIIPDGATTPVYGTVASIGLVASQSSGVATYPVTIDVTGNPGGLYPGAGAQVTIVVRQLSGVLVVPSAAVHPSVSGSVVYVMQAGRQVSRPVTVGTSSGALTEITGGIRAGEQVVLPGLGPRGAGARPRGITRGGGLGGGGLGGGGLGGGGFGGGGFGGGGLGGAGG